MIPLRSFDLSTLSSLASIVLISISLSGDNALVIGMAARNLSEKQRRLAFVGAIGGAIVLRVFFAGLFAVLLYRTALPFIRLVGGIVLVWIAWKFIVDSTDPDGEERDAGSFWEAIVIILVADASMSLDNMLAVASASNGKLWLIGVGLAISIPLLFLGASIVIRVLDRYPFLVWVGGALIAWVAGGLIAEEPVLEGVITFPHASWILGGVLVIAVSIGAYVWGRARERRAGPA